MRKFPPILVLLLVAATSMGQPMKNDTLTVVQIPPIIVCDSGTECLWDYSMMKDSLSHEVFVVRDSTRPEAMEVRKMRTKHLYRTAHDTLFRTGFENATTLMRFVEPIAYYKMPLSLGDSLSGCFVGRGEYGHLLPVTSEGTYISRVDGRGALVLPHERYDSVFRVTIEYNVVEHIYDTTHFHIKECRWYKPDYLYPLLEATEVTTYLPEDTTLHRFAFYAMIENEEEPALRVDSLTETQEDSIGTDLAFTEGRFLPNPVVNDLLVTYHLTRTATIWFSLQNSSGLVMYRSSPKSQEEGDWQLTIPMSGYPTDDYVLYIHVDDIVLAETIIKL